MFIIFNGTGRLGNQLFQLNGIEYFTRHIKKRSFIILNMPEIINCIKTQLDLRITNKKILIKLFDKHLCYVLNFLQRVRIIGSLLCSFKYYKSYKLEDFYYVKKGLLPIIWVPTLYFQKSNYIEKPAFSIKEIHIKKAELFLAKHSLRKKKLVFVHIRKTDYIDFTVFDKKGADLPLIYFRRAIQWFIQNIENPYFIFLTDDREFVEDNFSDISEKIISNLDQYGDLALMSLCEYGIISNSSFSWWGAFFMKNRKKVIAPRYWLGFKSQIEYPPGIIAPWMDTIDVD